MKHIKLEIDRLTDRDVTFHVSEQSHRGSEFGVRADTFYSKNGNIRLCSSACPEWRPWDNYLYVRGSDRGLDKSKMRASLEEFESIKLAVAEYNKINGPRIMIDLPEDLFTF